MEKLVVLKLDGNLENGVKVSLEIREDKVGLKVDCSGFLPEAHPLKNAHESWQATYRKWGELSSRMIPTKLVYPDSINRFYSESKTCANSLRSQLNKWLVSESFRSIREAWLKELKREDSVRVLIKADSEQLWKLPWHLWDLIEDCPNAEAALSAPGFSQRVSSQTVTSKKQASILAILGDSTGIDVDKDRQILSNLPSASTVFLVSPQRDELSEQLWDQPWDMIFFAGHSKAEGDTGRICINEQESLTIEDLKLALKKAISRGLKLAIFNSCDGLGLAQALADLQIPQVIVMREQVPDVVAQEFLKYFLASFLSDQSLHISVREARERLEKLEGKYPCASWLPVILQSPAAAEEPIRWKDWSVRRSSKNSKQQQPIVQQEHGVRQRREPSWFRNRRVPVVLLSSVIATTAVMGVRYFGGLQNWELGSFDGMQRLRPVFENEAPDSRLLVVGITEKDLQLREQDGRKGSLSDQALSLLLQTLRANRAQVVGLDIYHDFPVTKSQRQLGSLMYNSKRKANNFFAVCKVSDRTRNNPGIAPPPEVPEWRTGFGDIILDDYDVLRRYLMIMTPPLESPCTTHSAISFDLALYYLAAKKFKPQFNKSRELQLGRVSFERLLPHKGVYQLQDMWGYQSLLNYRYYKGSPIDFVQQVSLDQILHGQGNKNYISNRVVLIGAVNSNSHDDVATPYSNGGTSERMPGVIAQAQMTSQILSAVLDGRPLLFFWPWWGDSLWVFVWSIVEGLLIWRFRSFLGRGLVITATGVCLYISCFVLLLKTGNWLPFVPSCLATASTAMFVVAYKRKFPS